MSADSVNPRTSRRALSGAVVLSLTTLVVSAANYLLNFVLTRLLEPEEFGDTALALTLVLSASVVAATLQLVTARSIAAAPEQADAVRRTLRRGALLAGGIALAGLGGGSWLIADALHVSTPWMPLLIALGLPVYFMQAVDRGALQGRMKFNLLALSYGAEAAVRVTVTVALVAAGFGVTGASIGILLSFVASAVVGRAAGGRPSRTAGALPWESLRPTVVGAVILLLGQGLMNNADILIAKAVLDPATAGIYAAAAVLGRSVFFISWSVVHVVFPVLASNTVTRRQHRRILGIAIGVIAAIGAAAAAGAALFGTELVRALFGDGYGAADQILVPYLVATTLFAIANLLAAADLARSSPAGPALLLCAAAGQTALLLLFGDTSQALAWLQVAGSAAAVILLLTRQCLRVPAPQGPVQHQEVLPAPRPTTAIQPERTS